MQMPFARLFKNVLDQKQTQNSAKIVQKLKQVRSAH